MFLSATCSGLPLFPHLKSLEAQSINLGDFNAIFPFPCSSPSLHDITFSIDESLVYKTVPRFLASTFRAVAPKAPNLEALRFQQLPPPVHFVTPLRF